MTGDPEVWFQRARELAECGNLVVVREDGKHLLLPAMKPGSVKPEMIKTVEQMIPSTTKRRAAVVADISWASVDQPSIQTANQAIPFWGLLMGFSCIGHAVWVFQGNASLLCAGCRDADVLIVDSALLGKLPGNWQTENTGVMRNPQVLVHDRASYKLLRADLNAGAPRPH